MCVEFKRRLAEKEGGCKDRENSGVCARVYVCVYRCVRVFFLCICERERENVCVCLHDHAVRAMPISCAPISPLTAVL